VTAFEILTGAVGVLQRRGRCVGDFEVGDGRVCLLGALAVAAGGDADLWRFLREFDMADLDVQDAPLVEAARLVAEVIAPLQPVRRMSIDQLVTLIGDAHDAATDQQIFSVLSSAAEAARPKVPVMA
jgi:hypothetical protein